MSQHYEQLKNNTVFPNDILRIVLEYADDIEVKSVYTMVSNGYEDKINGSSIELSIRSQYGGTIVDKSFSRNVLSQSIRMTTNANISWLARCYIDSVFIRVSRSNPNSPDMTDAKRATIVKDNVNTVRAAIKAIDSQVMEEAMSFGYTTYTINVRILGTTFTVSHMLVHKLMRALLKQHDDYVEYSRL